MKTSYETKELRFVIEPDWTVVHVLLSEPTDGTPHVRGWHTARFRKNFSVREILDSMYNEEDINPILWPQEPPMVTPAIA